MVSGVANVQVFGSQKYAVRVQVDPDQLARAGIGVDEVQQAIQASNTNLPTGRLDGDKQAFTIQSSGDSGCGGVPPHYCRLSQRLPRASGAARNDTGLGRER